MGWGFGGGGIWNFGGPYLTSFGFQYGHLIVATVGIIQAFISSSTIRHYFFRMVTAKLYSRRYAASKNVVSLQKYYNLHLDLLFVTLLTNSLKHQKYLQLSSPI